MNAHVHAGMGIAAIAAAGITGIAAMGAPPIAPAIPTPWAISQNAVLTATEVPIGGLLTSFLGNQGTYCSIICPLLVQTGVTAAMTTTQAPAVFVAALQSGDVLKALGAAAASVTGPTNDAAAAAILADGTLVAPRALNAFEVGVVGLLNVAAAAPGGLPAIIDAVQVARQQTFDALNAPIVPNPTPTVMPQGLLQVTVISAINVVAAVIFPAFNDVLGAVFSAPNAAAQELATSGDPARALAAGINSATQSANAAVTVVAESVAKAVNDIRAAAGQSNPGDTVALRHNPAATKATETKPGHRSAVTPKTTPKTAAPHSRSRSIGQSTASA